MNRIGHRISTLENIAFAIVMQKRYKVADCEKHQTVRVN